MVTYFRTLFSLSFTPFPFREFAALSCMVIIPLSRLVISGFLSVRPSVRPFSYSWRSPFFFDLSVLAELMMHSDGKFMIRSYEIRIRSDNAWLDSHFHLRKV
jgi:hypothetical protein